MIFTAADVALFMAAFIAGAGVGYFGMSIIMRALR